MICKICSFVTSACFQGRILEKYQIQYYYCSKCEFLFTEHPFWLEEAYTSPIAKTDIGLLSRNLDLTRQIAVLLYFLFGPQVKTLDYAGGYGILTRLLRDIGFASFWQDKYQLNLFSPEFALVNHPKERIDCITTFESFEHFIDPLAELEVMTSYAQNIFFTTALLPHPVPLPDTWWYYTPLTGQHISFYSKNTLMFLAKKFNLHFSSFYGIHFFAEKHYSERFCMYLLKYSNPLFHFYVKKKMRSLLSSDFETILANTKAGMQQQQNLLPLNKPLQNFNA